MTHEMTWNVRCARQTWAWATHVRVIKCESTRKCDVWGVLFPPSVGCSRLLSAVNDLTTTKKSCKVLLLSSLVKKPHFHELRCAWHWWILWAPPGIVPLPPWCAGWRRRRMPFLVLPRKNRWKVALLQTQGENGTIFVNASLKSDRSFIGALRPDVLRGRPVFFQNFSHSSDDRR